MSLIICTDFEAGRTKSKCCAGQGKQVVRLKGGCPSVFSRVGSEMQALQAAGIPYELVPGVSSALAAPLLAGQAMQTRQAVWGLRRAGTALSLVPLADHGTLCCQLSDAS